jgi:hypothetical protein
MTSSTDNIEIKQKVFPAKVVDILNGGIRLAINRGEEHKIRQNQRVLVYRLSDEEIKDPETGESLGYLEIYKGTGKVIHIQEKMSIIESDRRGWKKVESSSLIPSFLSDPPISSEYLLEFDNPEIGDMVKPI